MLYSKFICELKPGTSGGEKEMEYQEKASEPQKLLSSLY